MDLVIGRDAMPDYLYKSGGLWPRADAPGRSQLPIYSDNPACLRPGRAGSRLWPCLDEIQFSAQGCYGESRRHRRKAQTRQPDRRAAAAASTGRCGPAYVAAPIRKTGGLEKWPCGPPRKVRPCGGHGDLCLDLSNGDRAEELIHLYRAADAQVKAARTFRKTFAARPLAAAAAEGATERRETSR